MSFLTGKTKQTQNIPSDITGLRKDIVGQLGEGGLNQALYGLAPGGSIPPELQRIFQSGLSPVLAQAKESAGNLSGSGLGNTIGTAAGRSYNDFITNMLNRSADRFTSLLSGFGLTGVAPPTTTYQPGFLDYLFQGAQAAAPLLGPIGMAAVDAGKKTTQMAEGAGPYSSG